MNPKKKKSYKKMKKEVVNNDFMEELKELKVLSAFSNIATDSSDVDALKEEFANWFIGDQYLTTLTGPEGYDFQMSMGFPQHRRLRELRIPFCAIMEMMVGRVKLCLPPSIPEDSFLLRVREDLESGSLCLVLTHDNFEALSYGSLVPRADVIVKNIPIIEKFDINKIKKLENQEYDLNTEREI